MPVASRASLRFLLLRYARRTNNKTCGRSQKETPSGRMVFFFGMPRAGLSSLPRPARSALNQEVRQGSCEWLCHSWDAGSESSLVTLFAFAVCEAYKQQNLWAITKRNTIRQDGVFFWNAAGRFELAASTGAKRVESRGPAGLLRMALPFVGCR